MLGITKFRFKTDAVARFHERTGPMPVSSRRAKAIGTLTRLKNGAETEIFSPVTASLITGNVVPRNVAKVRATKSTLLKRNEPSRETTASILFSLSRSTFL